MTVKQEAAFQEYLEECQEMLDRISTNLTDIQKNGLNKDLLASIYRDIHTIKGSAQLFGFLKIGRLAHALETCLDPVRKEKLLLKKDLIDCIFIGLDYIEIALESIKKIKKEPEECVDLDKLLVQFFNSIEMNFTKKYPILKDIILAVDIQKTNFAVNNNKERAVEVTSGNDDNSQGFGFFGEPEVKRKENLTTIGTKPVENDLVISKKEEITNKNSNVTVNAADKDMKKIATDENINETIRVQVSLLNSLMNLVGELVLIRNQLLQHAHELFR